MTAGEIAAVVVALTGLAFVIAPLLRRDAAEAERVGAAVSEERDLASRREMLLASLKDLEEDFASGKVDEADYRDLKQRLSSEAVDVMKQLDALDQARQRSTPVGMPRRKGRAPGSPA